MSTAKSPIIDDTSFVTAAVHINGKALDESIQIFSILINESINYPAKAEISILDGYDAINPFPAFNSASFEAGNQLSVFLGYGAATEPVFEGVILNGTLNSTNNGVLKITCISTKPVVSVAAISNTPLSEIPFPLLKLTYGEDIIDFSLMKTKKAGAPVLDWLSGFIKFQGSAKATIHHLVEIKEFGKAIATEAYIASVEHVVENGNWFTTIALGVPKAIVF
ncbi:MAG: hypothetical protein RLZZ316_881 [Bacteroidota bacterium]